MRKQFKIANGAIIKEMFYLIREKRNINGGGRTHAF